MDSYEINEQKELAGIVNHALRGPKHRIFETLLCQHLVRATLTSDLLWKAQLITNATLMLSDEKIDSLDIKKEEAKIISTLCTCFRNRVKIKIKDSSKFVVKIRFGFEWTKENYIKYFSEWIIPDGLSYLPAFVDTSLGYCIVVWHCAFCRTEIGDKERGIFGIVEKVYGRFCVFCGISLDSDNPKPFIHSYRFQPISDVSEVLLFFGLCQALSEEGYATLENNFLDWCIPLVLELMRKLTQTLRPEIYNSIIKMFTETRQEDQS